MARSMTSSAWCGLPMGRRTRTNIPGENSRPVPTVRRGGGAAEGEVVAGDLAIDRRLDPREFQSQLVNLEAFFGGGDAGVRFRHGGAVLVEFLLADRAGRGLVELLVSRQR